MKHHKSFAACAWILLLSMAAFAHAEGQDDLAREAIRQLREKWAGKEGWQMRLSPEQKSTLSTLQPDVSDVLLDMIEKPETPQLRTFAATIYVQLWDRLTSEERNLYLQSAMTAHAEMRPRYPQGIEASIGMGYSVLGWYDSLHPNLKFQTVTTCLLDTVPYAPAFRYPGPGATTGWIQTKPLARGKHTLRVRTEWTATDGAETYSGRAESPAYEFEIVSGTMPDELIVPTDPQLEALVARSLTLADDLEAQRAKQTGSRVAPRTGQHRGPQTTWITQAGSHVALSLIQWEVKPPLPVDLCFAVEIQEVESGKIHAAYPLIAYKNQTRSGFIQLRDVHAFEGKLGKLPVRVLLKASRKDALTDLRVTRYFGGSLTHENLSLEMSKAAKQ